MCRDVTKGGRGEDAKVGKISVWGKERGKSWSDLPQLLFR